MANIAALPFCYACGPEAAQTATVHGFQPKSPVNPPGFNPVATPPSLKSMYSPFWCVNSYSSIKAMKLNICHVPRAGRDCIASKGFIAAKSANLTLFVTLKYSCGEILSKVKPSLWNAYQQS